MNLMQEFDTIAAISTPFGTGGIGVIRLSGSDSFKIIEKIFRGKISKNGISHGWLVDGDTKIDEVIILEFENPNSYTGEDVAEIQCHGGINVVNNVLKLVLKNGARMAEKGEFTKRAFLNKKMDLSQAEAVADLIHSKTSKFAVVSAQNLSGHLAKKIAEMRENLFELLSRIVAGIDFPEDVAEPEYDYLKENTEKIISDIDKILKEANASNIMRNGVSVAVIGKSNVGKSSLFNALLNVERAIVTDIEGTTRDTLRETLDLGAPVTLIDTAGFRNADDISKVEAIGIEYSKQALEEASVVLFVYDAREGLSDEVNSYVLDLAKGKKTIIAANKCDLTDKRECDKLYISALTGEGLEELKEKIKECISELTTENIDYATNIRQQDCLTKAKESLSQALEGIKNEELQDLISIDMKAALLALDELSGEVITDEILNNIFDNFCIGK